MTIVAVALVSGLISATLLIFGLGLILPVSAGVSDVCSLAAAGSGIAFLGSLDNF